MVNGQQGTQSQEKVNELLGTGRILDIINALKQVYNVSSIRELDEEIKLQALLNALQLTKDEFDCLIADNSPVYRTIKGHAFEIVFEYLLNSVGVSVTAVGGDGDVDLIVNGFGLQLKTPNSAGTKGSIVQFKTHKTHGAKSEQEHMDYYHKVEDFADYLVGLISYDPLKLILISKHELPTHAKSHLHISSPFSIKWDDHLGVNNFEQIGIGQISLTFNKHFPIENEILPKSSSLLKLTSSIIIDTILTASNFRIWDMSIKGWSREVAISNFFADKNIKSIKPTTVRFTRGDKSDFALKKKDGTYDFFQVKGVSTNNCTFNGEKTIIATETQLTRGRVNDHATQSRLYLVSDFDYVIIGVDPPISKLIDRQLGRDKGLYWDFYCIPVAELKNHHVFTNRLKSLQSFKIHELEKFRIQDSFFLKYETS